MSSENIKMPGLNDLQVSHTLMLREYLTKYPRENCDYTIVNLLVWGLIYENKFLLYKERLIIFNTRHSYIFFPIGEELAPEELKELVLLFKDYYPKAEMILIPKEYLDEHPDFGDFFDIREDRDWADYIYSNENMVTLSGRKLAKKKNLISQFRRAYPDYHVMKITEDRLIHIMQFTKKWRRERDIDDPYLNTEFKAIQNAIDNWSSLPIEGIIVCNNNKIAAYSIFSQQNADMATVHFEKFDPYMKGSAQVITWETSKYLQSRYTWLNREQDIGLAGLRQAKLSYVPDRLVPFFGSVLKV